MDAREGNTLTERTYSQYGVSLCSDAGRQRYGLTTDRTAIAAMHSQSSPSSDVPLA